MRLFLLLAALVACGWALFSLPRGEAADTREGPRKGIDWSQSQTLTPEELDARIVRCVLGDEAPFLDRSDCLARGGTPRDV